MAVRIGLCRDDDIEDVIRFVDEHWKRGHILVSDRTLLDWQHREDKGYSFVIARRDSDDAILGLLGFIPTRRFDPALSANNTVWLATWKVRDDAGIAGLGLSLLQHLVRVERHIAIGALGLNPSTIPVYRALGYQIGELEHYVLPNPAVAQFELARLGRTVRRSAAGTPVRARKLDDADLVALQDRPSRPLTSVVPLKTTEYFRRRYAKHPAYSYLVFALGDGDRVDGLIATRLAEHAGRRALRVVDFIGDAPLLGQCAPVFEQLLSEHDAEYADVYNVGFPREAFNGAGFVHIDPDGPCIVPDHFEPFERRNVRLWFAIKGGGDPLLFKGDADQDRPNRPRQAM